MTQYTDELEHAIISHAHLQRPAQAGHFDVLTFPERPYHPQVCRAIIIKTCPNGRVHVIAHSWHPTTELGALKNLLAKLQLETAEILDFRGPRQVDVPGGESNDGPRNGDAHRRNGGRRERIVGRIIRLFGRGRERNEGRREEDGCCHYDQDYATPQQPPRPSRRPTDDRGPVDAAMPPTPPQPSPTPAPRTPLQSTVRPQTPYRSHPSQRIHQAQGLMTPPVTPSRRPSTPSRSILRPTRPQDVTVQPTTPTTQFHDLEPRLREARNNMHRNGDDHIHRNDNMHTNHTIHLNTPYTDGHQRGRGDRNARDDQA